MYACENLDQAGQCQEWAEVAVLPVLTQADVYALGSATALAFAVAWGTGMTVRFLLTMYASRHN